MYSEYIQALYLTEQAVSRKDAVNKCIDLGYKFIEHFEKIYREGVTSMDFYHHCSEMSGWWKSVLNLRLTSTNNHLSDSKLVDWFFTGGSNVGTLFPDETERLVYCKFMNELLNHKDSKISDILEVLL